MHNRWKWSFLSFLMTSNWCKKCALPLWKTFFIMMTHQNLFFTKIPPRKALSALYSIWKLSIIDENGQCPLDQNAEITISRFRVFIVYFSWKFFFLQPYFRATFWSSELYYFGIDIKTLDDKIILIKCHPLLMFEFRGREGGYKIQTLLIQADNKNQTRQKRGSKTP